MYRIIPLLQCTQCIRYRGILYTIPLYLEFKINIFSIFWQVSGVKSKLIRFLDFLDFFLIFGCLKTGLNSRDLDTQKCSHSALVDISVPPLHRSFHKQRAMVRRELDNREPWKPQREIVKRPRDTKPPSQILDCPQVEKAILNNLPHLHMATLGLADKATYGEIKSDLKTCLSKGRLPPPPSRLSLDPSKVPSSRPVLTQKATTTSSLSSSWPCTTTTLR